MKDEERYKLHFGPYYPPKVRRGDRLFDEIHGTVIVGRWSEGEIIWPCIRRPGMRVPILCGDLVKAVRREARHTVAHWWGVSLPKVTEWRMALGVDLFNEGSRRLKSALSKEPLALAALAKAQRRAADPVLCTRLARLRWRHGEFPARGRQWTAREDAMLGTMPDSKLARELVCWQSIVQRRRRRLGIRPFRKISPRNNTLAISPRKLLARRLALRLSQTTVAQRAELPTYRQLECAIKRYVAMEAVGRLASALECRPEDILLRHGPRCRTIPDDSLLGKMSDQALARKWRLPREKIRRRRLDLGIPIYVPPPKPVPDESLLGTRSDAALAALWRVPFGRVYERRRKLGIPSFWGTRRDGASARKEVAFEDAKRLTGGVRLR